MNKDFVNRNYEFNQIDEGLKDNQIILVNGKHKIGTTAFLKEIKNRYSNNGISLFIPIEKNLTNISECIVKEIAKIKKTENIAINYIIDLANHIMKGEIPSNLFDMILEDIPSVGNVLQMIWRNKKHKELYYCLDVVDPFLTFLKSVFTYFQDKKISLIIIVDNLHLDLESNISELLGVLKNKNYVHLIASVYIDEVEYITQKYELMISGKIDKQPFIVNVETPSKQMIKLLANKLEVELSEAEKEFIYNEAHENIYKIFEYLGNTENLELNTRTLRILDLMKVLKFSVSREELYGLYKCIDSNIEKIEFENSLDLLEKNSYIDNNNIVNESKLQDSEHRMDLYFCMIIITYYLNNEKYLDKRKLKRLISIGKIAYPNNLHYIDKFFKQYITLCMKTNDLNIEKNDINIAFADNKQRENVKNAMCAFFMICDFESAYEYYKKIKNIYKNDVELKILWGITLNRVRLHDKAKKVFLELLNQCNHVDLKCIISSFLIINYIYMNDMNEARNTYENNKTILEHSKYYLYFVRNSISVISHDTDEAITMLEEMISCVDKDDYFLKGSLENNLGRSYLSTKNYPEAKIHFENAFNIMTEHYKFIHSTIILNNLAIYYFLTENFDECIKNIELAEGQSLEFMQTSFIRLNKQTFLFQQNHKQALLELDALEKVFIKKKIPHLCQAYFSIRCLLETFDYNKDNLKKYLLQLERYKDVLRPDKTEKNIQIYKDVLENKREINKLLWDELYVPLYLVYWYINPFELIN